MPTKTKKRSGSSVSSASRRSGYWFDKRTANRRVEFIETMCHHVKGEWAGQLFKLAEWERRFVRNLFGWKRRSDKTRRYRVAYVEIPKKNGKSTLGSAIAVLLEFGDGEPGPEVYSVAADRGQAAIIFDIAKRMVEIERTLADGAEVYMRSIVRPSNHGFYKVLSSDVPTKHGINAHGIIFDEFHAQPNRDLYDTLKGAGASRRQPLLVIFTTAGFDRHSICWELHDYAIKVRDGIIEDDAFLPIIYGASEKDDWKKPATWKKANPNYGVSVKPDFLREECARAAENPAAQNTFRRLHLNQWTEQATRWLDMAVWKRCGGAVNSAELIGQECFAGLDLSATTDITALELVFPNDGDVKVLSFFWVPEESARQRTRRDRVQYDQWIRQGHIEATEGDVVDYDIVRKRINELADNYRFREVALDPWNGRQLATQLAGDGFEMVELRQGFASLTSPTKALETLLRKQTLRHGDNPVLTWMASNVAVEQDAAGNIKPSKKRSTEKIDGIVALIMAISRMGVAESKVSVYEDRGIFTI